MLLLNATDTLSTIDEGTTSFIKDLVELFSNSTLYREVLAGLPAPLNNPLVCLVGTIAFCLLVFGILWDRIMSWRASIKSKKNALEEKKRRAEIDRKAAENEIKQLEREEKENQRRFEQQKRDDERYEAEQRRYEAEQKRQMDRDRRIDDREERQQKRMDNFLNFTMMAKQMNMACQFLSIDDFESKKQVHEKYIEKFDDKQVEARIAYDVDAKWRDITEEEKKTIALEEAERIYAEKLEEAKAQAEAEKLQVIDDLKAQIAEREKARETELKQIELEKLKSEQTITENEEKIRQLQVVIASKDNDSDAQIKTFEENINLLSSEKAELEEKHNEKERIIAEYEVKCQELENALSQAQELAKNAGQSTSPDENIMIKTLNDQLETVNEQLNKEKTILAENENKISDLLAQIENSKNEVELTKTAYGNLLEEKDSEIKSYKDQIAELEKQISAINNENRMKALETEIKHENERKEEEKKVKEAVEKQIEDCDIEKFVETTVEEISVDLNNSAEVEKLFKQQETEKAKQEIYAEKQNFCKANGTTISEMTEFDKLMNSYESKQQRKEENDINLRKQAEENARNINQLKQDVEDAKSDKASQEEAYKEVVLDNESISKNMEIVQEQIENEKNKKSGIGTLFSGFSGRKKKGENS